MKTDIHPKIRKYWENKGASIHSTIDFDKNIYYYTLIIKSIFIAIIYNSGLKYYCFDNNIFQYYTEGDALIKIRKLKLESFA